MVPKLYLLWGECSFFFRRKENKNIIKIPIINGGCVLDVCFFILLPADTCTLKVLSIAI